MAEKSQTQDNRSWSEFDGFTPIASMVLPSSHYGAIFHGVIDGVELWAWEVFLLGPRDESLRFASGSTFTYGEALQSVQAVVTMWVASGRTLAELREDNHAKYSNVAKAPKPLGFPTRNLG